MPPNLHACRRRRGAEEPPHPRPPPDEAGLPVAQSLRPSPDRTRAPAENRHTHTTLVFCRAAENLNSWSQQLFYSERSRSFLEEGRAPWRVQRVDIVRDVVVEREPPPESRHQQIANWVIEIDCAESEFSHLCLIRRRSRPIVSRASAPSGIYSAHPKPCSDLSIDEEIEDTVKNHLTDGPSISVSTGGGLRRTRAVRRRTPSYCRTFELRRRDIERSCRGQRWAL